MLVGKLTGTGSLKGTLSGTGSLIGTLSGGGVGHGIPAGGTPGQVLIKNSDTDYDTTWSDDLSDLKSALKSGDEEDAIYHLGFYLDENGDLCQVEEETNNG